MANLETKVPSLEERLAWIQSHRGVQKFNKLTMAAGLPRGPFFILMLRRLIISDATQMR